METGVVRNAGALAGTKRARKPSAVAAEVALEIAEAAQAAAMTKKARLTKVAPIKPAGKVAPTRVIKITAAAARPLPKASPMPRAPIPACFALLPPLSKSAGIRAAAATKRGLYHPEEEDDGADQVYASGGSGWIKWGPAC